MVRPGLKENKVSSSSSSSSQKTKQKITRMPCLNTVVVECNTDKFEMKMKFTKCDKYHYNAIEECVVKSTNEKHTRKFRVEKDDVMAHLRGGQRAYLTDKKERYFRYQCENDFESVFKVLESTP